MDVEEKVLGYSISNLVDGLMKTPRLDVNTIRELHEDYFVLKLMHSRIISRFIGLCFFHSEVSRMKTKSRLIQLRAGVTLWGLRLARVFACFDSIASSLEAGKHSTAFDCKESLQKRAARLCSAIGPV